MSESTRIAEQSSTVVATADATADEWTQFLSAVKYDVTADMRRRQRRIKHTKVARFE